MKHILLCMFFSISLFSGCAYKPEALPMKPAMLGDYFQVDGKITLSNVATTDRLKTWTDSLIKMLSDELVKRGATISEDSDNILYVEIYDTYQNPLYFYWANKCILRVNIKTSKEHSRQFEVVDVSGLSCQRACGFCMTKAVAEILNDRQTLKDIGATVKPL